MRDERTEAAFLVRMWLESTDVPSRPQWRGFVQGLPERDRFYFSNVYEIADFINSHLNRLRGGSG